MGAILFVITFVLLVVVFGFLTSKFIDYDRVILGFLCLVLAIIFSVVAIIGAINCFIWAEVKLNLDAYRAKNLETREVYLAQLAAYEANRNNDVVASEIYLNLYEKIVSFNKEIRRAKGHSWLSEGLLWDPSYAGLEPIPIERNLTN